MERGEPALVPEWYKSANGGASGSANPKHLAGASEQLDEHHLGVSSRNRLSLSASDRGVPCSSASADRSPTSSRGSPSANGSVIRDRDSHPYSSFGRSRRDRERDLDSRIRDRVRNRSSLVDNGRDNSDSFKSGSKNRLRRSQSMVSGRQIESWTKRPGNGLVLQNDSGKGIISGGSVISGISKSFFERDFPMLGTEEKQRLPDRASSPGICTAVQNLSIGSSAVNRGYGWTSALVEVPALQTPIVTTGLNMAEALTQAPRVRSPPQLSVDTRIEELTLRQCKQLIPVTPSMPKTLVSSSSDKSKSRGRGDLSGSPKVGQQSSPQLVNHALRTTPRSDIPKVSQAGNFQVLNRERIGICPTENDVSTVSRAVNPQSIVAAASVSPLKAPLSPLSPKLKADKGTNLSSKQNCFGEKRSLSQAQNRNDFFNALRKKTTMNNSIATCEPSSAASACSSEKLGEQSSGTNASINMENSTGTSGSGLDFSIESGKAVTGDGDTCGPKSFLSEKVENKTCLVPVIDLEEEVSFLKSLGWEENAGEEALTAEEINAFVKEYEKLEPSLKLSHLKFRPVMVDLPKKGVSGTAGSGTSGLSSSSCKAEA